MAKGKRNLAVKKAANKAKIEDCKLEVKSWLGIGGEWSTLELIILAAQKLGVTLRGDIHPNQQIKWICTRIRQAERPINAVKTKKDFYSSRAWKILRYQAFEKYGNRCQCCGATPDDGISLHVDHIKPRSTHPELQIDLNNMQILCEDCNVAKINQWDTDWR